MASSCTDPSRLHPGLGFARRRLLLAAAAAAGAGCAASAPPALRLRGPGVLLIAGNGHVRTDLGVPRWLDTATRVRCEAIGVLEAGDATPAYDRILRIARQDRVDPCAAMQPPAPATPPAG